MEASKISELMTRNVISVEPDCQLKQAVFTMQQRKISFLIIAESGKPLGVLSERDIVRLACQHTDPEQLQVQDVMTAPVITVTEDANIFQVYDLLNSKKIRHMVVVNDAGLITGLTTLTNILGGLSIEYFIELKQVANIMSKNICTLNPDDSIQHALEVMTEKRISCVIITDHNKPVGIITERDITRLYSTDILENTTLTNIMSHPVRTTDSGTFIPQANAIMQQEKLRHLIVVNADGSLAGLISQTDIARRIEEHYVGYLRSMVTRQDQDLQYEHARFSIFFVQNPNAVVSYDVHGNIVDVNQAFCRLSGYKQQDLIGKNFEYLIHPEDIASARNSFQKACKDETKHVELRIMQKSGCIAHVFNSYLSIYANHHVHRIYSIMHDITEKKRVGQQLQIAEEKAQLLTQAVECANDAITITDRQGSIEFVNAAFTRITGYTAEEAIGNKPSILKSGEHDASFYKKMWTGITNGKSWQSRLINRRKNGEFFPAELSIAPVFNTEGEITHFVGIKRDLTEQAELEDKFHQAQKMEAIGTLVGGIAHDFNNILAGITGNIYLAKHEAKQLPCVVKRLGKIEQVSLRAADMISQLLTFARKGMVSMEEIPLTSFIKETLKFIHTSVPENIAVHKDVCAEQLHIEGDTTQLHQVLINLINNARDAVEHVDAPSIAIKLESFHADDAFAENHSYFNTGCYAHLSVEDNGSGMSEQQTEHIFEPFFTTKEQGKGTGLGLSMVFGAIKTHHGFVEVASIEGKGSSFHVYIPLLNKKAIAASTSLEKKFANGHGELILLADDEQLVRETNAEVLESIGYRVLQAKDGLEAIEIFRTHWEEVAMVLLDVVMPYLGGMPLAKCIREINTDVPVIFMTGYDKEHVLYGAENMSNSKTLTKPVQLDALSRAMRQLLD